MFVYELSGSGFESSCSHLTFRFRTRFEHKVPLHSVDYRVWVHSETRTVSIHISFQTYIETPLLNAFFFSLPFVFVFCFVVVVVLFVCVFIFLIWFKVSLLSTGNVPCTDDLFKTKLFTLKFHFLRFLGQ